MNEYSPWFIYEDDKYIIRHRQVGIPSITGIVWTSREFQITDKIRQIYDKILIPLDRKNPDLDMNISIEKAKRMIDSKYSGPLPDLGW